MKPNPKALDWKDPCLRPAKENEIARIIDPWAFTEHGTAARCTEARQKARKILGAVQSAFPLWGITEKMVKAGAEAMIASDTPDGPAYTTLAKACLSAALGVDGYIAPEQAATPNKDPNE